ncbi:MAG: copper amine oxidase N-terminal domain-containing protein [Clostridia bacterium]
MKRLLSLLLMLSLALMPVLAIAEGEDVKIYIDGVLLEPMDVNGNPVTPVIIDGTTYLPVRAVAGAIGYEVKWDGETRSVYLSSGDNDVIAADDAIFSNLEYYIGNPYELLGRSAFLNRLKALMGEDYDRLLMPALVTCYAMGDGDSIALHCSAPDKAFVNEAVIDISSSGRIDIAVLSPHDADFGSKNVVKYYSNKCPDYIDSESVITFISTHVTGNDLGYGIIDFVSGNPAPSSFAGTYTDVLNQGSFSFTENGTGYKFSGKISRTDGNCSTNGSLVLTNNCAVCMENGNPSILFAFSGNYLTVIGLDSVTKVLTSVCMR